MIVTLTSTWIVNPRGPLREDSQPEDLWSLINAIGSIMSGSPLSPWFIGESNDGELRNTAQAENLILELYPADQLKSSAVEFLPAIMLATDMALRKAFLPFELSKVRLDLHPGERPGRRPGTSEAPWWNNYFNHAHSAHDNPKYAIELSPESAGFAGIAQSACPNLFEADGARLLAHSWGLVECAALVSLLTQVEPDWSSLSIEARPLEAV